MKIKLSPNQNTKNRFSQTLKSWFPILKANISDLEKDIFKYIEENPYIEVKSGFEKEYNSIFNKKNIYNNSVSNSRTDSIEALTIEKQSTYEKLFDQIQPPLFPTLLSQNVAYEIIENLNEDGYFEGDIDKIAKLNNTTSAIVESIRLRFMHIEPIGIASLNMQESFLFQLDTSDVSEELYQLCTKIITDIKTPALYKNEKKFNEAIKIIKSFIIPPLIDFLDDDEQVIPDIFIYTDIDNNIEVKLNDSYYPTITIKNDISTDHNFVKVKIKEAKNLVDALDMRKATLHKIGLMIVEYQYEYFQGGELKPMKLQDIADEFGHNSSTISRAIANKYIECQRGVIAIKNFFTTAIDDETSNNSIKEYLKILIKEENRAKPLSDNKIVKKISEKFNINIGRRTITKYRLQLGIESSSDRKKTYLLMVI